MIDSTAKQAYVSPPNGTLEIHVIRDAQPRVEITLDLGIPFTVFSMKIPLVEDQPRAMSGLIAESIHVLMDEVATFMMSMEFVEEIIVQIYATVLAAFKGMSNEADSSKEQDKIGADPIVKTFEGTFQLPMVFVNETQDKVITAASKIKRAPKVRHLELTYSPKDKTTVDDAARVIRQYRNRSLKQQSRPLYVVVYDQQGRPSGTLSLGPQFKNKLLNLTTKKGSVDFSPAISFPNEQALRAGQVKGIPKAISVGGLTYVASAIAGVDMALYRGQQDWLVKFVDGSTAVFPGRPTFRTMRRLNYKVPRNRFNWTTIPQQEEPQIEEKPQIEESVEESISDHADPNRIVQPGGVPDPLASL